jgi:hypothetical protein
MAWADDLARIKARDANDDAARVVRLRALDAKIAEERDRFARIIGAGLNAINASQEDRELVFKRCGVKTTPPVHTQRKG